MTSLADKTVLITGAASGMGRELALQAARKRARVAITDINGVALEQTRATILAQGGTVLLASAFDIADRSAVLGFAERLQRAHGPMNVLINNAGISTWGRIQDMPHEDWRRLIEVNLMGTVHMLESFVPPMIRAGGGGHIVNVSSAAGLFGLPWHAAYSASKFGVRGISEVLRFDLREHNIRVSLVCPGAVNTGLVDTIRVHGADPSSAAYRRLRARFLRHATPAPVAARRILRGIERNRYYIYTSADIAVGHWLQRHAPWSYELLMRRLNRRLTRAAITPQAQEVAARGNP